MKCLGVKYIDVCNLLGNGSKNKTDLWVDREMIKQTKATVTYKISVVGTHVRILSTLLYV